MLKQFVENELEKIRDQIAELEKEIKWKTRPNNS